MSTLVEREMAGMENDNDVLLDQERTLCPFCDLGPSLLMLLIVGLSVQRSGPETDICT